MLGIQPGEQHSGVEDDSDDVVALVGCDGAAVGMAGPNGAVEAFEAFLESFVCEVSDVEDSSHLVHFVEKASSAGCEVSFGICAGGVSPCS